MLIEALVAGVTDPHELLGQATTRLRATSEELAAALQGCIGPHQQLMLTIQLRHVDALTKEIERLDHEIEKRLEPVADAIERLDTIPGVGKRGAEELVAAIGTDMSRFPSSRHLASWAKICPGTYESAGKRSSAGIGKGNPHLRTTLVEAA